MPDEVEARVDSKEDELALLRLPELKEPLREITELLSQPQRAFVIGAGVSRSAGLPMMCEMTDVVLEKVGVDSPIHPILENIIKNYTGASGCSIEDYMSEIVDAISVVERRASRNVKDPTAKIGNNSYSSDELKGALVEIKRGIEMTIKDTNANIENHRKFVRAVHGRLQSGKIGDSRPVDYFTLNYDTLLEDALALERVPTVDGFVGGVTGWWQADVYDDAKAKARVFKVHGSIDWCSIEDDPLPRRVRQSLRYDGKKDTVLIWPAATKYRETQRDPYAQIIERMRQSLHPLSNDVVLTILGYSFGDEHINTELDLALRGADGRLTFLVFSSDDVPTGFLEKWTTDDATKDYVRLHTNRGFFHGDRHIESKTDIPWWKFEVLIRILGGER